MIFTETIAKYKNARYTSELMCMKKSVKAISSPKEDLKMLKAEAVTSFSKAWIPLSNVVVRESGRYHIASTAYRTEYKF